MIALDTNLVIRHLVEDDEKQLAEVRALVARCFEQREECLLLDAVLCEIEWVLTSVFNASKEAVIEAVEALLEDRIYAFENRRVVEEALASYRAGKADFSDYLMGKKAHALRAASFYTFDKAFYTFDKALGKEEGFMLLEAAKG